MKLIIDIPDKLYIDLKERGVNSFLAPEFYTIEKAIVDCVTYEEYLYNIQDQIIEAKKYLVDNKIIYAFETLTTIQNMLKEMFITLERDNK